jgi:hypothetical protein
MINATIPRMGSNTSMIPATENGNALQMDTNIFDKIGYTVLEYARSIRLLGSGNTGQTTSNTSNTRINARGPRLVRGPGFVLDGKL